MSVGTPSINEKISEAMVCHCFSVTEQEIRCQIDSDQLDSVEQVTSSTCAGRGCTACHIRIRRMLAGLAPKCGIFETCMDCGEYKHCCGCEIREAS